MEAGIRGLERATAELLHRLDQRARRVADVVLYGGLAVEPVEDRVEEAIAETPGEFILREPDTRHSGPDLDPGHGFTGRQCSQGSNTSDSFTSILSASRMNLSMALIGFLSGLALQKLET